MTQLQQMAIKINTNIRLPKKFYLKNITYIPKSPIMANVFIKTVMKNFAYPIILRLSSKSRSLIASLKLITMITTSKYFI